MDRTLRYTSNIIYPRLCYLSEFIKCVDMNLLIVYYKDENVVEWVFSLNFNWGNKIFNLLHDLSVSILQGITMCGAFQEIAEAEEKIKLSAVYCSINWSRKQLCWLNRGSLLSSRCCLRIHNHWHSHRPTADNATLCFIPLHFPLTPLTRAPQIFFRPSRVPREY